MKLWSWAYILLVEIHKCDWTCDSDKSLQKVLEDSESVNKFNVDLGS